MKASNLHDLWASPDNTRLTSKQFSFRLPTHVAAKIEALCEMFPNKNRTQLVGDLLTSALDELEQNLPESVGERLRPDLEQFLDEQEGERSGPYYYVGGLRGRFRELANRYYKEIEKDLGNEAATELYTIYYLTKSDIEKG